MLNKNVMAKKTYKNRVIVNSLKDGVVFGESFKKIKGYTDYLIGNFGTVVHRLKDRPIHSIET